MNYLSRELEVFLGKIISERPLVYLNGPRQVGKSTLANNILSVNDVNYISFDAPFILASAKSDPAVFINSLPKNKLNIIDEIQMAPEIFRYLKIAIDERRLQGETAGLYLLTGSANLLALPGLSEALVGRMSVLTLLPFSSTEYMQSKTNFIERLFGQELEYRKYDEYDLLEVIKNATYPELAVNPNINRIQWLDDYLTTILQRDVRNVADIKNPEKIIMLLSLLSLRAGGLINNSEVAMEVGLDARTYEKYKASVLNTFIIFELKSWSKPNRINKRFTKSPKLYFTDTNMLSYVMKRDMDDVYKTDKVAFGHLFENFVATEIKKNISSLKDVEISHFRTSDFKEVDFVLEKYNGDTIGIEVKLSATVDAKDLRGLKVLKDAVGDKFKKGVVVYTGREVVPLGENLWAVPVCYFWQ